LLQNLPNFKQAALYLEKKTNRHKWELDQMYVDIEAYYKELENILAIKYETATKLAAEKRAKLNKVTEQSEEIKKEVLKAQKTVLDSRRPHPEPKEPQFTELPPVPWVPKLPVSGGLDARGKKKKALPNPELKQLIDAAESGALDGADMWPISDANFPSQAQLLKLGKAMTVRNAILDQKRKAEEDLRERLMETYGTEHEKWEMMEKRRLRELDRNKKDCRKQNLKFDSFGEIVSRMQREYEQVQADLSIVTDLRSLHAKSKQRFKMSRFKQQLEFNRQKQYLDSLKKRLLRALKARRHALSLPGTAKDDLEHAKLCRQSEAALRTLRYEIFECKQILQSEGLRLRTLFQEEHRLCLNELSRAKLSREIIIQRDCYDRILERYKFEVVNLYSEMEKFRLRESEGDDEGVETVNDMGERYIPEKRWRSPDVIRCQKLIDICMAKINLTEGLGNSTGLSQKLVLEVMTVKWGADFLPMRDSWTDRADFDRAQHLLEDTLQWAQTERAKLEAKRKLTERDKTDLNMQMQALQAQQEVAIVTHETETKTITNCSTDVINVMRDHLDQYRQESQEKIQELDKSIINLSRECQKVREELLAQEMVFDEKIKVLWAFIHTLQTAVQQLSARMEMVLEEKEKIVIESKLVADHMRYHLRIERKHCANLLFIIQSQRGTAKFLTDVIAKLTAESKVYVTQQLQEKSNLRREIWEQVFAFTRLSTDVDALFEFFAARMANLAGARASLNNQLASNGAALVLAALCKSPRPVIRKFAARALGGMGWDGFVETRILLWDSVMFWKMFKAAVIAKEKEEFQAGLDRFNQNGKMEAIINMNGEVEEFVPSGNMSLRTIIKQRRQWALRAARRREGPNTANQRQLNVRDGVIPSLLEMSLKDGAVDWEISRNAALAISIASYEPSNHHEMMSSQLCVDMIISMCRGVDAEVQTHAAVTLANLCHRDENAQRLFGNSGAVEALVRLCTSSVVDVLEAATSALANLTSYSDHNCLKVLECNGVEILVKVVTQAYSENLLDLDQNDEVQANAAEMLANVSRFSVDSTVPYFSGKIIDALVVMCASQNKQLRRHIPLVMGNIGQVETCRAEIGRKGGIEALFLVLEDTDTTIQANTLWSLCNLMWHPPNQERAGRFMTEVLAFLESPWAPVRTQAITLLANTLYYNNSNRVRFLESEGAMELILSFASNRPDESLVEGSLRALLSLSYVDAIAMWLGPTGGYIPMFIGFLHVPYYSRDAMRYSLEILCNLCLHHVNRRIIYDNGGVDAIVGLHIDTDPHVRDLSVQVIEYLDDITPAEVLARTKQDIGLERMVTLAASSDPLVRAVAAESIGEEIWRDPSKQARVNEIGGVDVLLGIAANKTEPVESLLPALWSLRNALHDQPQAKLQFGFRDGISIMNSVVRRGFAGMYAEQSEKIFEAVLSCLSTAALHDERNSRRLLMVALPVVLDLADGRITHATVFEGETGNFNNSVGTLGGTMSGTIQSSRVQSQVLGGMRGEGVNSLAKALLLQLAPYNYVVCRNCHKRQDLHGTTCYNCGHPLLVEPDITEIELRKTFERQSSTLSKTLGLSPTKGKSVGSMSMSTSLKGAGVGGLRKLAEERAREKEQQGHAGGGGMGGDVALSTSVRGTSSNMRLHSPQPLPSSVSERRTGDARTGTWESKLAETGAERGSAVTMSQTMPLPHLSADGTYTSGSAGSSRPPAGASKGKPVGSAKMMLSKSAAALDRALVGADQLNAGGGGRSGTASRSAASEDKSGEK
jgi:HEAT repeat protein